MQAFQRILCPIDFAEHSMAALEVALKLARQNDASLHLLNVAPFPANKDGFQHGPKLPFPCVETERWEQLARIARERIPPPMRYDTLVMAGDPAQQVLDAARDLRADLIVMGTHGRRGLSRLIMGSVAERVVRESPIPVLTAHSTARVRKVT
ncbi:MAG: universal stress protein [Candidatus Binatus sp.]|nr:universal stress protein [Candidatus Binatus sp.]MDO8434245.1 universal stress protein [Candidatus Binatus sp.]